MMTDQCSPDSAEVAAREPYRNEALADWLEQAPRTMFKFGDGEREIVEPSYLLASDVDALIKMLRAAAQSVNMTWESAETAVIDAGSYYVVQHNGHEWRDFDLMIMKGVMVLHRLEPHYVRGRPEWIAKIVRPSALSSAQCGDPTLSARGVSAPAPRLPE